MSAMCRQGLTEALSLPEWIGLNFGDTLAGQEQSSDVQLEFSCILTAPNSPGSVVLTLSGGDAYLKSFSANVH